MTDDLSRAEIEAMALALFEKEWERAKSVTLPTFEDHKPYWIESATASHAAATRVREERGFVVVSRAFPNMVMDGPLVAVHAALLSATAPFAASQQRTADNA